MKPVTDLEALVRRMAGREDDRSARDRVRAADDFDPLVDESLSAETELLAEIRRKTRILFDDPDEADSPALRRPRTSGNQHGRSLTRGRTFRAGMMAMVAAISLGAVGWWLADRAATSRARELTGTLVATLRTELAARPARGPDQPLVRPDPGANQLALGRLEVDLAAIRANLDALGRLIAAAAPKTDLVPVPPVGKASAPPPAPGSKLETDLVAMSADLTAIRRELVNSEAATTRQIQEMRTVLHEVNTVVRRVLSRPPPSQDQMALPLLAVGVQALINNLQHQNTQVRGEAVEQLARLGPLAKSAVPALQQMLARESDRNIRSAIETALGIISSN